jgi:hypothetical protein
MSRKESIRLLYTPRCNLTISVFLTPSDIEIIPRVDISFEVCSIWHPNLYQISEMLPCINVGQTNLGHAIKNVSISGVYSADYGLRLWAKGSLFNPVREVFRSVINLMRKRLQGLRNINLHGWIISDIHGIPPPRCLFPVVTSTSRLEQLYGLKIHSRIPNELLLWVEIKIKPMPRTHDCLVATPHIKSMLIIVPC